MNDNIKKNLNANKMQWKNLIICLAIPILIGVISRLISNNSKATFDALIKPRFSPPSIVFPIVWTILYILMGIASYIILSKNASKNIDKNSSEIKNINKILEFENEKHIALSLYGIQLLFNLFWTFWFFKLKLYLFAFIWLMILWLLVLATIIKFSQISKLSSYLLIPYILWISFAAYLNFGIVLLN